jgi:hypothetical protein
MIELESEVWLVSKRNPNLPILKLSQSDFNLIKKGVFRKTGQLHNINNVDYFLPINISDNLKVKCKKMNVNITDLSFSMQEFMNPEVIKNLNYKIWIENFINLKNSNDDIYVICSKNTKKNYNSLIEKLEKSLFDLGIKVKTFYYISETFYNRDEDKIAHTKVKLLLQHIIGLKTDDNKISNKEITQYDEVFFYDDERTSINLCKQSNSILKFLYENSEKEIKDKVDSIIKEKSLYLFINETTYNKVNPFMTSKIEVKLDKIFKTFEGFKFRY